MKLIAATNNPNKLNEFRDIFRPAGIGIISMSEAGVSSEPAETGKTLEENARIKARALWNQCRKPVIADDTGLFVDALNGEPGLKSARFSGRDHDDDANIDLLLERMKNVPEEERTARFITALCYIDADGNERIVHGCCEGWVTFERMGRGFGYEPVFCLNNGFSLAMMGQEKKDLRSHRARACHKLVYHLRNIKKIRN